MVLSIELVLYGGLVHFNITIPHLELFQKVYSLELDRNGRRQ